jgi:hypothetical protein
VRNLLSWKKRPGGILPERHARGLCKHYEESNYSHD